MSLPTGKWYPLLQRTDLGTMSGLRDTNLLFGLARRALPLATRTTRPKGRISIRIGRAFDIYVSLISPMVKMFFPALSRPYCSVLYTRRLGAVFVANHSVHGCLGFFAAECRAVTPRWPRQARASAAFFMWCACRKTLSAWSRPGRTVPTPK